MAAESSNESALELFLLPNLKYTDANKAIIDEYLWKGLLFDIAVLFREDIRDL